MGNYNHSIRNDFRSNKMLTYLKASLDKPARYSFKIFFDTDVSPRHTVSSGCPSIVPHCQKIFEKIEDLQLKYFFSRSSFNEKSKG